MDVRFDLNGDAFVWNADKALANWRTHGGRLEAAAAAFGDPPFVLADAGGQSRLLAALRKHAVSDAVLEAA